jgi:hypothetical protein
VQVKLAPQSASPAQGFWMQWWPASHTRPPTHWLSSLQPAKQTFPPKHGPH